MLRNTAILPSVELGASDEGLSSASIKPKAYTHLMTASSVLWLSGLGDSGQLHRAATCRPAASDKSDFTSPATVLFGAAMIVIGRR